MHGTRLENGVSGGLEFIFIISLEVMTNNSKVSVKSTDPLAFCVRFFIVCLYGCTGWFCVCGSS